ncbi:MAG: hypothetical protein WB770_05415 [Acidimicrobiales bacterium]
MSEVDFYVPVPRSASRTERSFVDGISPTMTCSYGDLARSPRRSLVVAYELFPPTSARHPKGVAVHRIRNVGTWALSFRRGHVTHVVVCQGILEISTSADAGASDLLGLAEEELSRAPIADRS